MPPFTRPASLFGLLALIAASLISGAPANAHASGDTAPACALSPLGDRPLKTLADLRGQVVYVDFWASWCTPCARSFPHFEQLRKAFSAQGFEVLGINLDERTADAQKFLDRHNATFALAANPDGACPRAFGVKAMPTGYLIDRTGVIRQIFTGFRAGDETRLHEAIETLLRESPLAAGG
jgi:peroxiredoxin